MSAMLVGTGLALGIAASPHCMVMCASPCALVTDSRRNTAVFHVARIAGYSAVGAVIAAGALSLVEVNAFAPWLQPLWMMFQLALGIVGAYWLWTGHPVHHRQGGANVIVLRRPRSTVATALAGACWVALPCGVLQGALLVATLSSSAAGGGAFMGAFALASVPALASMSKLSQVRAWLPSRLRRRLSSGVAWRLAGLGVVCMSAFAVGHGVWQRVAAICAT